MLSPSRNTARQTYERLLDERLKSVDRLVESESSIVNARVAVFLLGLFCAYTVLGPWSWSYWVLVLPAAFFVGLVVRHRNLKLRIALVARSVRHFEQGLDRLDERWHGTGPNGQKYLQASHPYAGDLDLFGGGSIFQLLCAARTRVGEDTLAAWLLKPSEPASIRQRHEAIEELVDHVDLRERLATLDEDLQTSLHPEPLIQWASAPAALTDRIRPLIAIVLGLAAFSSLIIWYMTGQLWPLLVVVLMEGLFLLFTKAALKTLSHNVDRALGDLQVLVQVLAIIEEADFQTPRLQQLQESLRTDGRLPSREIEKLRRLVQRFEDMTRNQFVAIPSLLFMLFVHIVYAIERWRIRVGRHIPQWLYVVGEFEALVSLARYAYEHPHDVFPEIADEGPVVNCRQLGHPLIPADHCVRNDVLLDHDNQLLLISGSNMSGKSTLLRSVGVNVVLALAGAPVRAESMVVSPLVVGTSMRIMDSIHDGTSHFYAELKRLRLIVDLANGQPPLLFLLDEILHGTNSHDRRVGSEGIIRRLLDQHAIGLVTTHDLALAEIADRLGSVARNVHFEDQLVDGQMSFDYRMRDGVVQKSNALTLMRSLGLDV